MINIRKTRQAPINRKDNHQKTRYKSKDKELKILLLIMIFSLIFLISGIVFGVKFNDSELLKITFKYGGITLEQTAIAIKNVCQNKTNTPVKRWK